jgi:hypothetical protein
LSGLSAATFAGAKGITVSQEETKPRKTTAAASAFPGDLLRDDGGVVDIGDVQMLLVTLLAGVSYLTQVWDYMGHMPLAHTALPDVDTTILAVFGLGQGAYLAKKYVGGSDSPAARESTMAVTLKREKHEEAAGLSAVVRVDAGGIAVGKLGAWRLKDGDWKNFPEPPTVKNEESSWDLGPLPAGAVLRVRFSAAGNTAGEAFRVDYSLLQHGVPLKAPDAPFGEKLTLGAEATLDWEWRYELL